MVKSVYKNILGKNSDFLFSYPQYAKHLVESFRPNQIKSKEWLVYEITRFKKDFKKVAVLGSWNSILLYELLSASANVGEWDFFDIDFLTHEIREYYFKHNKMPINFNSWEVDAELYFSSNSLIGKEYDLIINPSCEHMNDIKAIPGPMYALTSNNYVDVPDHINTIERHEDLAIKNGINKILYEGTLKFPKYERYCTIGYAE